MARRVFKTRTFGRWCRKSRLPDFILCDAVAEMSHGLVDADLGGRVYKKRLPLHGRGKRAGARAMVGSNLEDRWFFLLGFGKSARENVAPDELVALRAYAQFLLALNAAQLNHAALKGELVEICHEEKSHTQ